MAYSGPQYGRSRTQAKGVIRGSHSGRRSSKSFSGTRTAFNDTDQSLTDAEDDSEANRASSIDSVEISPASRGISIQGVYG